MTLPLELESDNPATVYLESLSPGSYWAVRHSLETIAEILAGEDADPWTFPWADLRYQHTARVRRELVTRYSPSTVNRMLSALRGTLKNAWRLGLMEADDYQRASAVENVRAKVQPKGKAVGQEELAALFQVCAEDESPAGRRDAAMFAVLYGGGLRRAELCGLDLTDFDDADCSLTVRAGKGRRERTVYLPDSVCEYLQAWVEIREEEPGPLFCPVRMTGEVPISRLRGESLWYILKRRQGQAGLEGITPHSFRRRFVSGLLEAGVDLLTVQELVGHSNAVTTARYDRRGEATRRRATAKLQLLLG
ncbi:MAG TPA: tyrosine-type recombinase/integrase [Thermoanaerobaculia bacterium]|nr:tyrosine-type recombinase/integrase [Thermoanaerobaculia bacterium]